MVDALNKIPGVYCPKPKGAFYAIVRLPVDDSDKFAQWLLEDYSFENQTVMVAPASGFYSTPGLGKNEVRIAYVLKIDDLKNAMKTLQEALRVYPGRSVIK
jgi:aspartate aminotransferase